MFKNALFYAFRIWLAGWFIGNLLLVPFCLADVFAPTFPGEQAIGLALFFSGLGSFPVFLAMIFLNWLILRQEISPRAKVGYIGLCCFLGTVLPYLVFTSGMFSARVILLASVYLLGVAVGIFWGYKPFVLRQNFSPRSEKLLQEFGRSSQ